MHARMRLELLEPLVLDVLKPEHLLKSLRRSPELKEIRISFEPIEGEHRRYKARSFPDGERMYVRAIPPGVAEVEVEIDPPEALLELQTGRPLRLYRKLCHETAIALKRLARENVLRLYRLPDCGLVNLFLGRLAPYNPRKRLRLWRDNKGFRHAFGLARITITLRIFGN